MKRWLAVSLFLALSSCDSGGGGGGSGRQTVEGFWLMETELLEANCYNYSEVASSIGIKRINFVGIKEQGASINLDMLNAIGQPTATGGELPIGEAAEWDQNGNFLVELSDGGKQVFGISEDWRSLSADNVSNAPPGCSSASYNVRLKKLEESPDVRFANERVKAKVLGKDQTLPSQTLSDPGSYALYNVSLTEDELQSFRVTGLNDDYRLRLYDSGGRLRASGDKCLGNEESDSVACIENWDVYRTGRHYLLVRTTNLQPSDNSHILEASFQPPPEDL